MLNFKITQFSKKLDVWDLGIVGYNKKKLFEDRESSCVLDNHRFKLKFNEPQEVELKDFNNWNVFKIRPDNCKNYNCYVNIYTVDQITHDRDYLTSHSFQNDGNHYNR